MPGTERPTDQTPTPGVSGVNHEPDVARECVPPPAPVEATG